MTFVFAGIMLAVLLFYRNCGNEASIAVLLYPFLIHIEGCLFFCHNQLSGNWLSSIIGRTVPHLSFLQQHNWAWWPLQKVFIFSVFMHLFVLVITISSWSGEVVVVLSPSTGSDDLLCLPTTDNWGLHRPLASPNRSNTFFEIMNKRLKDIRSHCVRVDQIIMWLLLYIQKIWTTKEIVSYHALLFFGFYIFIGPLQKETHPWSFGFLLNWFFSFLKKRRNKLAELSFCWNIRLQIAHFTFSSFSGLPR